MVATKERATEIDLSDEMSIDYHCADCQNIFSINVTEHEMRTVLESHSEKCPSCGQTTGRGQVTCLQCGDSFVLA